MTGDKIKQTILENILTTMDYTTFELLPCNNMTFGVAHPHDRIIYTLHMTEII